MNWNKYQPKISRFLTDPSFQGVNRLFVSSFENEAQRTNCKQYCLPTRKIKKYNLSNCFFARLWLF